MDLHSNDTLQHHTNEHNAGHLDSWRTWFPNAHRCSPPHRHVLSLAGAPEQGHEVHVSRYVVDAAPNAVERPVEVGEVRLHQVSLATSAPFP